MNIAKKRLKYTKHSYFSMGSSGVGQKLNLVVTISISIFFIKFFICILQNNRFFLNLKSKIFRKINQKSKSSHNQ